MSSPKRKSAHLSPKKDGRPMTSSSPTRRMNQSLGNIRSQINIIEELNGKEIEN